MKIRSASTSTDLSGGVLPGGAEQRPRRLLRKPTPLPFIGRLPAATQYLTVTLLFLVCLACFAAAMVYDGARTQTLDRQAAAVNELQTLSQRMAMLAMRPLLGTRAVPDPLLVARKTFETDLYELGDGKGLLDAGDGAANLLRQVQVQWRGMAPDVDRIAKLMERGAPPEAMRPTLAASARDSEMLLSLTRQLGRAIATSRAGVYRARVLAWSASCGMALCIALLGFINVNMARLRAWEIDQVNERNQLAIARLIAEMKLLAAGDLTMQATVAEALTAPIARSINATVDGLRAINAGILDAANEVTRATSETQELSRALLDDAARQSQEIIRTHGAVTEMAQSIDAVTLSADDCATTAAQSLQAAENGSRAVQDAIDGMDRIRDQIQETAKRIKRLGENSQLINDIVSLIADITEQTHMLSLNAAIQAASAGEAGRGFYAVAEEVQRLAERSAEATHQVGAIVQTIQSDTQDAILAMERSTHGVVEGARQSLAAGEALAQITEVSQQLFTLIDSISFATRRQRDFARQVTASMQEILDINARTTRGTERTAESVGSLSRLAAKLRQSASGFKLP